MSNIVVGLVLCGYAALIALIIAVDLGGLIARWWSGRG